MAPGLLDCRAFGSFASLSEAQPWVRKLSVKAAQPAQPVQAASFAHSAQPCQFSPFPFCCVVMCCPLCVLSRRVARCAQRDAQHTARRATNRLLLFAARRYVRSASWDVSCEFFVLKCSELRARHQGQRHCRRRPEIVRARRVSPRTSTGKASAFIGGPIFRSQILAPGRCPGTLFDIILR